METEQHGMPHVEHKKGQQKQVGAYGVDENEVTDEKQGAEEFEDEADVKKAHEAAGCCRLGGNAVYFIQKG